MLITRSRSCIGTQTKLAITSAQQSRPIHQHSYRCSQINEVHLFFSVCSCIYNMFKMPSLCANTRMQTFPPPLVDLMPTTTDFDQSLLQFINTVDQCLIHALLQCIWHPKSCNPRVLGSGVKIQFFKLTFLYATLNDILLNVDFCISLHLFQWSNVSLQILHKQYLGEMGSETAI